MKKEKKYKIAFFIQSISQVGGIEKVTSIISNEMYRRGYDIIIINLYGPNNSPFSINKNIKILSINDNKTRLRERIFRNILSLRRILKSNKIELLIDADSNLSFISILACVGLKIKTISWEHFSISTPMGKVMRKFSRKLSLVFKNKYIVLTNIEKNILIQKNKKYSNNIEFINNPLPFKTDVLPNYKSKTILAVGRLEPEKGFDILINMSKQILHGFEDWKINIIGEGSQKKYLQNIIDEQGIGGRVNLLGYKKNVCKYLLEGTIFVMTSRTEGYPMVLLEAMNCGLPVVSFDCPYGPRELMRDNGFLVEMGNINKFISSLHELMKNENLRKKMGMRGRELSHDYDLNKIVDKWEKIINKM